MLFKNKEHVLEREVVHAGKIFLSARENNTNAYIIQDGQVLGFIFEDDKKIPVGKYTAGTIIGETNLLLDAKIQVNFEAITDVTLVKIVRQDFEKKLTKIDKTLLHIIRTMMKKLHMHEKSAVQKALDDSDIEDQAQEIVNHLLRDMQYERKKRYENVLLPHFNIMIKALESLKKQERHEKQKQVLEQKIEKAKAD